MKHTGAEILINLLERQGIQQIAGIPGGANLPMYDALSRSGNIRHILARHEQGAGFIAQGQARVTGRPAVFFRHFGSGSNQRDLGGRGCQAGFDSDHLYHWSSASGDDWYGCVSGDRYLWAQCSDNQAQLFRSFRQRASRDCSCRVQDRSISRPGPVWIDIPKDVQLEQVCVDDWPLPGSAELLQKWTQVVYK